MSTVLDNPPDQNTRSYTLRQLVLYALKLGTISFGGPVALVGYMHRDLVETRRGFSKAPTKKGLPISHFIHLDRPLLYHRL